MPPDPLGATAFGGRLSEPPFVKFWIRSSHDIIITFHIYTKTGLHFLYVMGFTYFHTFGTKHKDSTIRLTSRLHWASRGNLLVELHWADWFPPIIAFRHFNGPIH